MGLNDTVVLQRRQSACHQPICTVHPEAGGLSQNSLQTSCRLGPTCTKGRCYSLFPVNVSQVHDNCVCPLVNLFALAWVRDVVIVGDSVCDRACVRVVQLCFPVRLSCSCGGSLCAMRIHDMVWLSYPATSMCPARVAHHPVAHTQKHTNTVSAHRDIKAHTHAPVTDTNASTSTCQDTQEHMCVTHSVYACVTIMGYVVRESLLLIHRVSTRQTVRFAHTNLP